tara:strand:+ start:177 stop:671 length:495 start_codon:yes stop_codon:yes gene_type:complete
MPGPTKRQRDEGDSPTYPEELIEIIRLLLKLLIELNWGANHIVDYIDAADDEFFFEQEEENDALDAFLLESGLPGINPFIKFYREHNFCPENVAYALLMVIVREKKIGLSTLQYIYGRIGDANNGFFQEMLKDEIHNSYSEAEIKAFKSKRKQDRQSKKLKVDA